MAPRNKNIPTLFEKLQNFQKTNNLKARIAYSDIYQNILSLEFTLFEICCNLGIVFHGRAFERLDLVHIDQVLAFFSAC